jgi:hypothetical protein
MNQLIFNRTSKELQALFYGMSGSVPIAVAVDSSGAFLISAQSAVPITAVNLDIRNLTQSRDTVNVTATNLDIRDLNGAQDSVQVYNESFVESFTSTNVTSGTNILLTTNIGSYSGNSFFLRNTGGSTVTVTLQIAPVDDNNYYVTHIAAQGVSAGSNYLQAVTLPIKYARLSVAANTTVSVVAYYNGRA